MTQSVDAVLESLCDDPGCCRERLLHTAGIFYAERGHDACSTRELTGAAGVNLAAIAYYFGGKDGLQAAVIEHVVASCRDRTWVVFEHLDAAIARADGDPDQLAAATATFADAFLRAALPVNRETWWVTILTRAMGNLPENEAPLYESVFRPANQILRRLVIAATGESDPDRLGVLTEALTGDFLTFCKNYSVVLRSLEWDDFSEPHIDQIITVVTNRMQARVGLPQIPLAGRPAKLAAE